MKERLLFWTCLKLNELSLNFNCYIIFQNQNKFSIEKLTITQKSVIEIKQKIAFVCLKSIGFQI